MDNIIIPNKIEFQAKLVKFKENGLSTVQIVSDFDKTLTKAFIDGKKVLSTYSILREYKYLSPDYAAKAFELFNSYQPYENDLTISYEERKTKMDEWWDKHLELMIASGINKEVFVDIANKDLVQLREQCLEFFKILSKNNVPLLIFSAGLGDVIKQVLLKKDLLKENVDIIANRFNFDETGKVNGYSHDIVHVFNKNTISHDHDIPEKKNVILLGDSIGDMGMVEGIGFENIIRIGFLNDKIEENKEEYINLFDVLILNDGSMKKVNEILEEIKSKS